MLRILKINQSLPHLEKKRAAPYVPQVAVNAWLGGFESILKRMKPGNFNWFLHTMLFYHTKHVITQQKQKAKSQNNTDENEDMGLDQDESD
jgi:hypothetical protein